VSVALKRRLDKIEARLGPSGPSVADILKRRAPGEPPEPPLTAEALGQSDVGRLILARMRRFGMTLGEQK
jgi:hypothetical protein